MSSYHLKCLGCGHLNQSHRLWCESCQSILPSNQQKKHDGQPERDELARKQLYQNVLDDLQDLVENGQATPDLSTAIATFYETKLDEIDQTQAERAEQAAIHRRFVAAQQAAHAGHYQDAIATLRSGLKEHPQASLLNAAITEIEQRRERERLARAASESDHLLSEAEDCNRRGQYNEAEQKLKLAHQLNPDNQRVLDSLADVQQQIASSQRPTDSVEAQVSQHDNEEIVLATLVEQPLESSSVIPVTAENAAVVTTPNQIEKKVSRSFAVEEEIPNPTQRFVEAASKWSAVLKPFLLDNVGWFVGAFLVIAGFVVLIVTFWGNIEQNRILMQSLVYVSLAVATGLFFAMAYFMRLRYPQLESSSNVLLVIVTLLIPLVFAAAMLTTLVPVSPADITVQLTTG